MQTSATGYKRKEKLVHAWVVQLVEKTVHIKRNIFAKMFLMDSNLKGTITELKCKIYFLELGYMVSTPESPARYDFILDYEGKLLKVQVKTSKSDDEKLHFETCSSHITRDGATRRAYETEIDYFCTWFDNECYLIPVEECGTRGKTLRLVPTKNGQTKNICFAKDYIAKEILCK